MPLDHSDPTRRLSCGILFLTMLLALGCRPAPKLDMPNVDQTDVDRLLHRMEQRLMLMHDVARWKWKSNQPVTDLKREQELLETVVERGRDKGLDPDLVRRFFAAQMQAARAVQQADIDHWSANKDKPDAEATSLVVLRQQIDHLNDELIDALAVLAPRLGHPAVQETLRQRGEVIFSDEGLKRVRETVMAPLSR